MIYRVLTRFAWFNFLMNIVKKITEWAKRGKMLPLFHKGTIDEWP